MMMKMSYPELMNVVVNEMKIAFMNEEKFHSNSYSFMKYSIAVRADQLSVPYKFQGTIL